MKLDNDDMAGCGWVGVGGQGKAKEEEGVGEGERLPGEAKVNR